MVLTVLETSVLNRIILNRECQSLMIHHIDFRSELGASKRAGVSRFRNLPSREISTDNYESRKEAENRENGKPKGEN